MSPRADVQTVAAVSVGKPPGTGRDPLYWQLVYPDHNEDEPLTNASIRLSRRGPIHLWACRPERGPNGEDLRRKIFGVNLIDAESGRLFRPVWYRKRSLEINTENSGTIQLEATIIGRALRDADDEVNGTLFMSTDGEVFGEIAAWAFDSTAIDGLLLDA